MMMMRKWYKQLPGVGCSVHTDYVEVPIFPNFVDNFPDFLTIFPDFM